MLAAAGVAASLLVSGASTAVRPTAPAALTLAGRPVEVVVGLQQPALARFYATRRSIQSVASRHGRRDLRAPAARGYARTLAAAQRSVQARMVHAIPAAQVRWRYQTVLNGLAVVVP